MPKRKKAQNALEYLVTYGWAIILIAAVIAILFKLGVFTSTTFSNRAQPGSCLVQKPYGPNTTRMISLSGLCDNALPEFVDKFTGDTSFFDVENNLTVGGRNTLTITTWFYVRNLSTGDIRQNLISIKGRQICGGLFAVNNSMQTLEFAIDTPGKENRYFAPSNKIAPGHWYFAAAVYNGVAQAIYLNGTLLGTNSLTGNIARCFGYTYIGSDSAGLLHYLAGSESNVQVYSSALSKSEIQTLYYEGLGGIPIDLQDLLAWWPLNGNADDYSGNGQNGGPTSVTYDNQWTAAYTPP